MILQNLFKSVADDNVAIPTASAISSPLLSGRGQFIRNLLRDHDDTKSVYEEKEQTVVTQKMEDLKIAEKVVILELIFH